MIIICASYKPNTAPINRLLSFVKGLDLLQIKTRLVFIYPNQAYDKVDEKQYKHISIEYLWAHNMRHNKVVKYLLSFYDLKRYVDTLEVGANVFLFGGSEYLPILIGCNKLNVYEERTEHPEVNPVRPKLQQRRYLKSIPSLKGMFVISTKLKSVYEGLGVQNVRVVNMTVDASRFAGLQKERSESPYIAYCGTASNNKDGVDNLIRAFSIVHTKFPQYKLYIIGKAPSKNDESGNLGLVHELGLEESVVFTGIVPAKEMPQLLKNADLLALARPDGLQAQCGFPTKLGEYLLTENPVVVTKVGDIPLFLEDGKSALLATPGNIKEFTKKMIWALSNPDKATIIGKQGAEVANQNFNANIEVKKIVEEMQK